MNTPENNSFLLKATLFGVLVFSCGNVWAAASSCARASATSIDGSGGTGMGGTGVIANGTGMGGTGARPEPASSGMLIAGNVVYRRGEVVAQIDGHVRQLVLGDPVCVGETIVTSPSGDLRISMKDRGVVEIRPSTKLKIDKFAYNRTHHDVSTMTLLEGSSRFTTGMIGKTYPQNDLILTKYGIIGVRGTDHEATVVLPSDRRGFQPGTYDRVYQGTTFIRTAAGEIEIHSSQIGLSVDDRSLPQLLNEMPDFFGTTLSTGVATDQPVMRNEDDFNTSPESRGDALSQEIPHFPRLPELPEQPEWPELPELPEQPELPELPEPPDH